MNLTPNQRLLELERGKEFKAILLDVLARNQGRYDIVKRSCHELGVTDPTFRRWCIDYGIDIKEYRMGEHPRSESWKN